MNKAASWNINGVGFDAREAAREAARRQGKSLGEWLDGVIADHANELGVAPQAFGGQDRIDAVTARLERLSDRSASPTARRDGIDSADRTPARDRPASNRQEGRGLDDHDDDLSERSLQGRPGRLRPSDRDRFPRERSDRERPSSYRNVAHAGADDSDFLLEDAIDALERRAHRAERKTDLALASFAKIIDATESKRDDEREMFSALSRKLSDMESRIASRVSDDATRPIKGALARVEARLDTLGRRTLPDAAPYYATPAPVASTAADPAAAEPIQRLEAKLNSILEAIAAKPVAEPMQTSALAFAAARPQPDRDGRDQSQRDLDPYREPMPIAAPPFANRRLGAAIADIANQQRALDRGRGGPARPRQQPAAQQPLPMQGPIASAQAVPSGYDPVGGLQNDIAGLGAKIEEMRREFAARAVVPAMADPAPTPIDTLRAEIAAMAATMRAMAPQPAMHGQTGPQTGPMTPTQMTATLEAMRSDVARRDDERRRDKAKLAAVASQADLTGLKAEIAAIAKTLKQLAPRDRALDATIRGLTDKIQVARDTQPAESVVRPADDLVGELRRWLADIDPRATIGGLQREVRTIGDKLDDLNGVDTAALGRIQNQTEEIRDLLSAAANPLAVERIERQVASLADKIDLQPRLSSQDDLAFRETAADLRRMLENASGTALFEKIENRLEALTAKVDQAVQEASGARKVAEGSRQHFDQIQEQLVARYNGTAFETGDALQQPAGLESLSSLENLVRDLSVRIEAAQAPDANSHALEALQDQVARLSSRFERGDGDQSALSAIERSMHALFAHLEDTRAGVEAAAARAAQDATNAILARTAGRDGGSGALDPATARELAKLQAVQEEADHRTHQTLHAVHETLEKVVDRLSLMESGAAAPAASSRHDLRRPERRPSLDDQPALPDLLLEASDSANAMDALEAPLFAGAAPRKAPARTPPLVASRASPTDLDEHTGRSDFIAAARRAARVAQDDPSVVAMQRSDGPATAGDLRAGLIAKTRDYVASHKKPVLLGVAALFVILGTLAVMNAMPLGGGGSRLAADTDAPRQPKMAMTMAAPQQPAPSSSPATPSTTKGGRATLADLTPSALPAAPPPVTDALPGSDPVTTGSIQRLPSFAAQGAAQAAAGATPASLSGALKQLADAGNASAQYEIGSRYAEGRQLTKDMAAAAAWYEKAALQGLAPAQYKLASLYEKGLGVPHDKAKAKAWYIKAADAGNPRAMHNLAVLIADGDGKPDYASAVIWFRKAAEYGVHDSQYNLGILLARGLGTPQSLVQSYQWFAVAARQNDADAATKRDEVAAKLAPNDLAVAQALATAFHPKTADMAAIEIEPPAGGWDGATASSLVKSSRPKLSSL